MDSIPLFGIVPGLAINLAHVVWLHKNPDETITLYLAAPGPDGKNACHVSDENVLAALAKLIR
jgi:hypothetical protein